MLVLPLAVLFDRVEFGLNLTLHSVSAGGFVQALADAGIVERKSVTSQSNLLKPKVSFVSEAGLQVEGQLALSENAAGLTLTNASHLLANGIRFIRRAFEFSGLPPTALDGNDNFFGPFPEGDNADAYLEAQLAAFRDALDEFLAFVRELVPGGRISGKMWVRSCEVTHDMADADAPARSIALSKEALPGSPVRRQSFHPIFDGRQVERATVTCSWVIGSKKSGLRLKTYAKLRNLMRLELVVSNRSGIHRLIKHEGDERLSTDGTPAGDQVVAELLATLPAAARHLDDLRRHIVETPPLDRAHLELLAGFSPLLSVLFQRDDKPGPRLSRETVDKVYDALFQLLSLGEYWAYRQDRGEPLRDALELMAGDSAAVLEKSAGRAVHFVVRKEWTPAREAVAKLLEERD